MTSRRQAKFAGIRSGRVQGGPLPNGDVSCVELPDRYRIAASRGEGEFLRRSARASAASGSFTGRRGFGTPTVTSARPEEARGGAHPRRAHERLCASASCRSPRPRGSARAGRRVPAGGSWKIAGHVWHRSARARERRRLGCGGISRRIRLTARRGQSDGHARWREDRERENEQHALHPAFHDGRASKRRALLSASNRPNPEEHFHRLVIYEAWTPAVERIL